MYGSCLDYELFFVKICSFFDRSQSIGSEEKKKSPTFAENYCAIVFIAGEPVVSNLRQLVIAPVDEGMWPRKCSTRDPGRSRFKTVGLTNPRTVCHVLLCGNISRKYVNHRVMVFLFAPSILDSMFLLYS
ncbi:MAG: hypothetical protein DRI97_12765 [Bacteroidetes bacterium]|nr:MAG: hypothetical protein DRI97_12765 [Bacteroidota bacterium]